MPRACWARTSRAAGVDVDIHTALGAGAYICGEETALMESLEARRASRASGRRSRPTSACMASPPRSTTPDLRLGAGHPAERRGWFLNPGKPTTAARRSFGVGSRGQAGQLRDPPRHAVPGPAGMAGGVRGGPQAQGGDPGRFLHAGAAGRQDARAAPWTTTRSRRPVPAIGSGPSS